MLYNPNETHNPTRPACKESRRAAFTLMELLVVVAILVVLAAVAVPNYLGYVENSRRQTAKTSANNIAKAAEAFHVATDQWPQSLQQLTQPYDDGRGVHLPPSLRPEEILDPWGIPFQYVPPPGGQHNGAYGRPDVWTTPPGESVQLGNWRQ
jgi:general secretion pathway protein G